MAEGFRLVLASGEIVDCDAKTNPNLFEAQRLSLGLVGVATSERVCVMPAFHLEERTRKLPLDEALKRLDELAAATRHVEFFLFSYANAVMLKMLHPCEESDEPMAEEAGDAVFQACLDLAAAAPRFVPIIQRTLTRLGRASTRVGPS